VDTPIMLLHCYPYEREAGYLAQAFNNVYVDGGLAINYLGAGRRRSSAVSLRWRRSARFCTHRMASARPNCIISERNGVHHVLQGFVDADEWSEPDAIRIGDLIARGNARRAYGLP
jgi:hypothetical protein